MSATVSPAGRAVNGATCRAVPSVAKISAAMAEMSADAAGVGAAEADEAVTGWAYRTKTLRHVVSEHDVPTGAAQTPQNTTKQTQPHRPRQTFPLNVCKGATVTVSE